MDGGHERRSVDDTFHGGGENVAEEDEDILHAGRMKRRVNKEYSGALHFVEEVFARSRRSEQGSFRNVKGKNIQQCSVPHLSQHGSFSERPESMESDEDDDLPPDTTLLATQSMPNVRMQSFSSLQDMREPLSSGDNTQSSEQQQKESQNKRVPMRENSLKKRLGVITDLGHQFKNTMIRRSSSITSWSEKVDGRSDVNRSAAKPRHWTPEEDAMLRQAVKVHGERNWKLIAEMVPGRNHTQCLQRWSKVLTPGLKKGQWSPDEDELLIKLAQEQLNKCDEECKRGRIPWGIVKKGIPGRTAKQCRERWINNLNPEIRRGNWTTEEDQLILELYEQMPQRWAAISKQLEGRTENAVKIRWKSLTRDGVGTWKSDKVSVPANHIAFPHQEVLPKIKTEPFASQITSAGTSIQHKYFEQQESRFHSDFNSVPVFARSGQELRIPSPQPAPQAMSESQKETEAHFQRSARPNLLNAAPLPSAGSGSWRDMGSESQIWDAVKMLLPENNNESGPVSQTSTRGGTSMSSNSLFDSERIGNLSGNLLILPDSEV